MESSCPHLYILIAYQRLDTKEYHEMSFCDWEAALEFARWCHFSPETELISFVTK
jgi:hypothetical protein